MSESKQVETVDDATAKDPGRKRHRVRRGCLWALLLLVVFVSGLVCGAGLALRAVRRYVRKPEERVEHTTRWLDRRLKLTDDQAREVRQILRRQQQDLQQVAREVRPRVVNRLEKTAGQIGEVLDEEQKREWEEIVREFRKRWLPPEPQETDYEAPEETEGI